MAARNLSNIGRALFTADLVLGGSGDVLKPDLTSALLYQAPSFTSESLLKRVKEVFKRMGLPDWETVDRQHQPYNIDNGQHFGVLERELKALRAVKKAQDKLGPDADPHGAFLRILKTVESILQAVMRTLPGSELPPCDVKTIRKNAGLDRLEAVDPREKIATLCASLGQKLNRVVTSDTESFWGAYTEVSSQWPQASEVTRSTTLDELWKQGEQLAISILPRIKLSSPPTKITVWDKMYGYQAHGPKGETRIYLPETHKHGNVLRDFYLLATIGPTGFTLVSKLIDGAITRSIIRPHKAFGVMFTPTETLLKGWVSWCTREYLPQQLDTSFFTTLGIDPLDMEIYLDMIALREAMKAQFAFLAQDPNMRNEDIIKATLQESFPFPPGIIESTVGHYTTRPIWAALEAAQIHEGHQVVSQAIMKWDWPATLNKVIDVHDVVSIKQKLSME